MYSGQTYGFHYTCKYHAVVVSKCRRVGGNLPFICVNVHPQGSVNLTADFGILHATYAEYVDVTEYIFLLEMCTNVVWVIPVFTFVNTACVHSPVTALVLLHFFVLFVAYVMT